MDAKNLTSENSREFIRKPSKLLHEWNDHLEIFSLSQAIKNYRQSLLLQTDILQKTVVTLGSMRVTQLDSQGGL